jgi:hypothetical protein
VNQELIVKIVQSVCRCSQIIEYISTCVLRISAHEWSSDANWMSVKLKEKNHNSLWLNQHLYESLKTKRNLQREITQRVLWTVKIRVWDQNKNEFKMRIEKLHLYKWSLKFYVWKTMM